MHSKYVGSVDKGNHIERSCAVERIFGCGLLELTLPWGLMGIIRYLPVNRWFRASVCCAWTGLWCWLSPWMMDKVLLLNGWANSTPYRLRLPCDFSRWDDPQTVGWNVFLLVLLGLGVLAVGFAAAGIAQSRKKKA